MKLRNLNGAIRKAPDRSVKIVIATPFGPITAGLTKSELIAGLAELGLEATDETGMTIVEGALQFENGGALFGQVSWPATAGGVDGSESGQSADGPPTFDDEDLLAMGDDDDLLAADDDEDLLAD